MGRFAADTSVSVEKSRAEIEAILTRYGATRFGYMSGPEGADVVFECRQRRVRFHVPLPDRNARAFTHTPGRGLRRAADEQLREWEQACRQRWRALALVIKAKLEAVECGITSFESEFLAHIILPDGETVGEWIAPQLASAYSSGQMPPMLGPGGGGGA